MGKNFIVAGAGFRGFCDAMELLKIPGANVHIVEPLPFFGGIAYSREVKGFFVDKGVHVFDSIPVPLADIVNEIMDGKTHPIDFISRSAFNGVVTEGYSLPDLSSLDVSTKEQIKKEIIDIGKIAPDEKDCRTLKDVLVRRFGPTAGNIYSKIFAKVYSIGADEVEPNAMSHTSLHRLKFMDDEQMIELKKVSHLDKILAARRMNMGKIDDLVSIYPSTGEGMKGWCDRAVEWLKKKGTTITLGNKIISIRDTSSGVEVVTEKGTFNANQVIWSNDNVASLSTALGLEDGAKNLQHGTPMVFITLMARADKIGNLTYIQNFEPDGLTYRTAAAGIFSNQIKRDGTSFITCECPVTIGSSDWDNPNSMIQRVWEECKRLGVVSQDTELLDSDAIKVPGTFKLPKLGYSQKIEEFYAEIPKKTKRVLLRNVVPFFRREIYQDSLNLRDMVT